MEINKKLTDLETSFNLAGSIPVVAIFSSVLRIVAGKVQIFVSIFFGLTGLMGRIFSSDPKYYEEMTKKAAEHIKHGALNWIRGVGESLLAVTVLGTLGLLVYQACSETKFEPIIPYEPSIR